jgi:hypothetical protein
LWSSRQRHGRIKAGEHCCRLRIEFAGKSPYPQARSAVVLDSRHCSADRWPIVSLDSIECAWIRLSACNRLRDCVAAVPKLVDHFGRRRIHLPVQCATHLPSLDRYRTILRCGTTNVWVHSHQPILGLELFAGLQELQASRDSEDLGTMGWNHPRDVQASRLQCEGINDNHERAPTANSQRRHG